MNVETVINGLPITQYAFSKKDVKAVSIKVQVSPLSHQHYDAALKLVQKPSFGPWNNFGLRPLESHVE